VGGGSTHNLNRGGEGKRLCPSHRSRNKKRREGRKGEALPYSQARKSKRRHDPGGRKKRKSKKSLGSRKREMWSHNGTSIVKEKKRGVGAAPGLFGRQKEKKRKA